MKKLFFFFLVFCGYDLYGAGIPVVEQPMNGYGTPVTVSISTSAWTQVPTSQTSGRLGIFLDAPSTLNANLVGHLGNCTSTAIATTIRPIEIIRSDAFSYFFIREDVCLWLLSLHTAAESIHYQEFKQ